MTIQKIREALEFTRNFLEDNPDSQMQFEISAKMIREALAALDAMKPWPNPEEYRKIYREASEGDVSLVGFTSAMWAYETLTRHAMPEMCVEMPGEEVLVEMVKAANDLEKQKNFCTWLRSRLKLRSVSEVREEMGDLDERCRELKIMDDLWQAERARSEKLVEALENIASQATEEEFKDYHLVPKRHNCMAALARAALAEYEAGRDRG